jgi:hypothetical protein
VTQETSGALGPEDGKLVVLAKATRARTGAAEGAALRDLDGRTYAAATVDLSSLKVSALGVCIAMAVASGAKGAEAVVVLGDAEPSAGDLDALRDFAGTGVPAHYGAPDGTIGSTLSS